MPTDPAFSRNPKPPALAGGVFTYQKGVSAAKVVQLYEAHCDSQCDRIRGDGNRNAPLPAPTPEPSPTPEPIPNPSPSPAPPPAESGLTPLSDSPSEPDGPPEGTEKIGQTELIDPVVDVFEHWQSAMNHSRAKLDDKRRKKIRDALKNYPPEDLKKAVDGCLKSPFHMGENDQGAVYDGIDLILRDADHIDKFIGYADSPPTRRMSKSEQIAAQNEKVAQEFVEGFPSPPVHDESVVAEQKGDDSVVVGQSGFIDDIEL